MRDTLSRRLYTKVLVDPDSECFNWQAVRTRQGKYGRISVDGRLMLAHRISWELWNGPIPDGLEVHHTCDNTGCVNPAHLMPVTRRVHLRDLTPTALAYKQSRQTHCKNGHALTPDNLDPGHLRAGRRRCRTCRNRSSLAYYHRTSGRD